MRPVNGMAILPREPNHNCDQSERSTQLDPNDSMKTYNHIILINLNSNLIASDCNLVAGARWPAS